MSKKALANDYSFDPIPWRGPIFTKHARERCKQRHINPLHVGVHSSTNVKFGSRPRGDHLVVTTVYKKPPTEFVRVNSRSRSKYTTEGNILGQRRIRRDYGGHVVDGEEYMRRTHRAVCVPKDVLRHLKKISRKVDSCQEAQTKTKAQMNSEARMKDILRHLKKISKKVDSCQEAQTKTKAQMNSEARAIKHQKKLNRKRAKRRRKQEARYRSQKGLKNRL